jgi:hypothetical protein
VLVVPELGLATEKTCAIPGAGDGPQSCYGRPMSENAASGYADSDPEYATDAAAEIDVEVVEFEPDDPAILPKDQGDSGTADLPGASPPESGA